jgi:hypothetical protein
MLLMTARDLIHAAGRQPIVLLAMLVAPPALGLLRGLVAYTLFLTHENLLDKRLLVYGGPIVAMGTSQGLMRGNVSFKDSPRFDRLSGLMFLIALTFAVLLAIRKTFIGLSFFGSLTTLAAVDVATFALFKWGAYTRFRRTDEPRRDPPL